MKWREHFYTGIWHVHTDYTDGSNSVQEYCDLATQLGAPLICFAEHVSYNLSYRFSDYLRDITEARANSNNLIILGGVEVKSLGNYLNAGASLLDKADVVFGSLHANLESEVAYMTQVEALLKQPIDVWAHPTLPLKLSQIALSERHMDQIVSWLKQQRITVELNMRHNVPDAYFIARCLHAHVPILIGLDAHSVGDVQRYWQS